MDVLARELLPNGRRTGREWCAGSLAGERGRGCQVVLSGSKAGVWFDTASGLKGDALALVAAVLFRDDRRAAYRWALAWLGHATDGPRPTAPVAPERSAAAASEDETKRRRMAEAIWLGARPSLATTPAAAYLLGRGIDLAELTRQPRALRFAPSLYNTESRSSWPALVAAISGATGEHVATHRTWLARRPSGEWGKAPLQCAKMVLGAMKGGSVRLWRGQSGRPLAQALPDEEVAIAEGIETALSVAVCCPEMRVLSAISLGGLADIHLPDQVGRVLILADHDVSDAAKRGLDHAIDRHLRAGRKVRVCMPEEPATDWNDVLRRAVA